MQYTRNDWYVGCAETDLSDGAPVAATILDERIVLWRSGERIAALEDRCVHRAAALSLGRCEGINLRCMYHGLLFDSDGAVVEIPGQDVIPPNARVQVYPTAVRHGFVWLWMGDAAKVDRNLLPSSLKGVDFDDFATARGALDFAAEARLITDNLLDFSHVPFVHADSFRLSDEWAKTTTSVQQLDRGVRFERWIENGRGKFMYNPPADPFDDWLGYDYLIPGVLMMWSGIFPAGTARALDFGRPEFSAAMGQVSTNIQAITPMTERTSRYHFMVGVHRALGRGEEMVGPVLDVTVQAFNEDKRMIEAQQHVIDRHPDRSIMPTAHDRGITLYNRLKARLITEEGLLVTAGCNPPNDIRDPDK